MYKGGSGDQKSLALVAHLTLELFVITAVQ